MRFLKFPTSWTFSEKSGFILTSLIGLFTLVNALIAGAYYLTYRKSVVESGRQTDRLIEAANTQAEAAKKFSSSADAIRVQITNAVGDFEKAATQSAKDSQRSAANAVKSIEITQDSFRQDHRAWIGHIKSEITQFGENVPMKVKLTFHNAGKTPAINALHGVGFAVPHVFVRGMDADKLHVPLDNMGVLAPEATSIIEITNADVIPHYARLINGEEYLFIAGEVRYKDIYSNVEHRTNYCIFLKEISPPSTALCADGNTMN